jgi:hypothetical protein
MNVFWRLEGMNDTSPLRRHGFRVSALDGAILLLGAALTIWLQNESFPLWWIVPMALGHFLLFCNVFLVWRKLELAWAAGFVILVGIHLSVGYTDWIAPLLLQTPATVFVIWLQMRSPWYHGIFARRINPRLDDYLAGRLSR